MRLIFIRHGDPDYNRDCLTEIGIREAECLAYRVKDWDVTRFFYSPMGRARQTCEIGMKYTGRTAELAEWLHEITVPVPDPATGELGCAWNWMPDFWNDNQKLRDYFSWYDTFPYAGFPMKDVYEKACIGIDSLLSEYGYIRDGAGKPGFDILKSKAVYRTDHKHATDAGIQSDDVTLVFFCHFGVTGAILSHLLGISPVYLWQSFYLAPTSVTAVSAEERQPGTVGFRCQFFGDTKHLAAKNVPVSPSGYFTDTFSL